MLRIESEIPGADGTNIRGNKSGFPVVRFTDESGKETELRVTNSIVGNAVITGQSIVLRYSSGRSEWMEIVRNPIFSAPIFLLLLGPRSLVLGFVELFD